VEQRRRALETLVNVQRLLPGKRVLVTGHTGFKGGWISLWLKKLGAEVWGVSLPPPTNPSLHEIIKSHAFADK